MTNKHNAIQIKQNNERTQEKLNMCENIYLNKR